MKIQKRISNSSGMGHSGHSRVASSTLCSCGEARVRRGKTLAAREDQSDRPQEFKIPEPLRIDQNDLCAALERAILSSGKTGKAAKKLLKVLQPHLLKEEGDLLQTLGLLVPLAQGKISAEMRSVPLKTEHLKSRMFGIMREHIAIIEASRNLAQVARAERKLKLAVFTEHLILRAWTDEVVFYPAAILIGEYLKLRFEEHDQSLKI
ncbi:MAG: hypothetical protein ACLQVY_24030 [Limisphaerales bacterium]